MSSQTSWIIRHNCTMVCGGGSLDLIWQSVKSLGCVRWGIGRWICWPGQCMDCIWSEEVLCEVDWKRKCVISSRSGTLHHGAAYSGWGPTPYGRRARSVNRLIWLRMVCVYIRALWRPGASATVLVDSLHWSRRCRCLRQKCQSCDDVIPGSSLLRDSSNLWQAMSQPQNCCHIETCGAICTPQVGLQQPKSFLCRRGWRPSKLLFVGMKCFCNVKLTNDYKRSDAWFNSLNFTSENVPFWVNFIKIT